MILRQTVLILILTKARTSAFQLRLIQAVTAFVDTPGVPIGSRPA